MSQPDMPFHSRRFTTTVRRANSVVSRTSSPSQRLVEAQLDQARFHSLNPRAPRRGAGVPLQRKVVKHHAVMAA
jgi:hypothetical protein